METSAVDCVPIVDFEAYSLEKEKPDSEKFQKLVDEVHQAFTTIGFVYLKNTGYPTKAIRDAFDKSRAFFLLGNDVKLKYRRGDIIPNSNFGYIQTEQEG
ncbi:hypothetical protein HOLleu_24846 [Holothuria leucospilota]|uniref:Non-haem dioxygenase N-terminal domain-containing protein n=1 Tax=Holothuria leucospilota TaxID=206669 RepID=A0A9Q1H314_HOLLE|nr:hypothetical protein HOLleu_24845 [Holothuria leucospilota]KAJ8031604.1 hypothetical protein HOLleu_24846 [Holothuria leucospilota]